MRWPTGLFVCALSLAQGCTTVRTPECHTSSRRQWQHLCRRMRREQPSHTVGAARPRPLTNLEQESLRAAARNIESSVVRIHTTLACGPTGNRSRATRHTAAESGGTGVVLAGGLILTNEHVLRDAASIEVLLGDGSALVVERVVSDALWDLAVLRVDRRDLRPLRPARDAVGTGAAVVAVGRQVPGAGSYRTGVVTAKSVSLQNELAPARERCYGSLIESTTKLEPGFSGGPLVDARGKLVGLNVAVSGDTSSDCCRGYAIPFDQRTRQAIAHLAARATAPPKPRVVKLTHPGTGP